MTPSRAVAEGVVSRLDERLTGHEVRLSYEYEDHGTSCLVWLSFVDSDSDELPGLWIYEAAGATTIDLLDPGDIPCDEGELARYVLARATGADSATAQRVVWPRPPKRRWFW